MTPADDAPPDDLWLLGGQAVLLGWANLARYAEALRVEIPLVADRMELRGYDWIGRPIGLTSHGVVLLYDAAFEELMEFDTPSGGLDSSSLFDSAADNFGASEHTAFLARLDLSLMPAGKCAGFTIPPQLGGEVSANNLELYEVPVYWHLLSVLDAILYPLPNGLTLRSISAVQG